MHYIAKQVKTRQNIGRDIGGEVPYIGYRNRQISGKRTIPVYANITRLHAQVSAPSKTVSTAATDKISFATYHATCADIVDVATNLFYETNKFMADNQRNWNGFCTHRSRYRYGGLFHRWRCYKPGSAFFLTS